MNSALTSCSLMFSLPPVQLRAEPWSRFEMGPIFCTAKKLPSDLDGCTCFYFFLMFQTYVIEGQTFCFGSCTAWKYMFPMVKHFKGCVIPKTSREITFCKHLVPSANFVSAHTPLRANSVDLSVISNFWKRKERRKMALKMEFQARIFLMSRIICKN